MAKVWISRFDPELIHVFKRLFIGIGVKTIGYLTIAAGIFLAIRDKNLAYKIVYIGVFLVISGWSLIYIALRQSKYGQR